MQPPQTQQLALSQAPPPLGRGAAFVYGRGVGIGTSQQFLRLVGGQWVPTSINPRSAPDLMACREFLQRQSEGPHKAYETHQHWGAKVGGRVQQLPMTADVGAFPGGGGGAGRVLGGLNAQQQYTTVGAPPNSGQQVQQSQQSQQLRPQAPPLPPSHNPHNTGGGPQSLPPHSQHHPHPHSAIAQHNQHHQVLTSGGATNLGGSVQQVPSGVGPPGSNQGQQGNHHDLNAQGITQVSSQQIQQVSGVVIPTGGTHQIMYQPNNQNAQQQGPQQPTPQVRRLINGQGTPQQHQYFQHQTQQQQQQNAALLQQQQHPGQHQRQVHTHPQSMHVNAYQNYIQANMIPQALIHSSNTPNIYQQFTMPQARPGATTTQYQPIPQAAAGPNVYHNMNSYHQMQAPIYYQPQQQVKPQAIQAPPPQRERKIIAIIDPVTKLNILDKITPGSAKQSQPDSPVQSRESSEGNTPAPGATPPNKSVSNIQAQFALQVTQVATGVDKNKENANDNVISTIESRVESCMDLSNDVRENIKLTNNSSVDSSSKDSDINKIARNVPDHIVNKVQQAHVSSYQSTPPLATAAVAQQGAPVSSVPQSQRQNKQARGAVPVVAPIPSQPQSGAQQPAQHQPPKSAGNQLTKQSSPPQPSKPSNQSQPKTSGNQATSSKGSPSSTQHGIQHSKSHSTPPVQKSSQHQPPSKPAPQQAKLTTETVFVPSNIQVEQQQQPKVLNEQPPLSRAAPQVISLPPQAQIPVITQQVSQSSTVPLHKSDSPQIQVAPEPEMIIVPIEEKILPPMAPVAELVRVPHVMPKSEFAPKKVQVDMAPRYLDSQISTQSAHKITTTQSAPKIISALPKVPSQPDQSLVKEDSLNGTQTNIAAQVPPSRLIGEQLSQQAMAPIKPVEKIYPLHKEPPQKAEQDIPPVAANCNDSLNLHTGKRGKEKLVVEDLTPEQMDSKGNEITKEELPIKINATACELPTTPEVVKPSLEKSDNLLPTKIASTKVSPFEDVSVVTFQPRPSQIPKSDIGFSPNTPGITFGGDSHVVHPESLVRAAEPIQINEPTVIEHSPPLTNNVEEFKATENHDDGSFKKPNTVNIIKSTKKLITSEPFVEPNMMESVPNQIPTPIVEIPSVMDSGKRQYGRDFLLQLQQNPLSLMRPDSLPNLEVVLDGPHQRSYEHKQPKMMQDFTPSFLQSANRNRGGPPTNYNKQQMSMGRNSQQGRKAPKVIDIKLSSSSEVKLKTTENAWKPSTKESKVKEECPDGNSSKHEDLLKRVRGILNKLTPDNFEKLVVRVKSLPIENYLDLEAIIGLIFEKAVDEQSFSSTYAMLCQVLSTMSVKVDESSLSNKELKEGKEARFRNLIINRCQKEFEKDNSKDQRFMEITKQLEEATTTEQRLELNALIDYEETKLRKRSVGNIRFIGELYKLKMLTSPIMMRIIEGLLKKKDEESLECLCKLLTTIGKNLETSAKSSAQAQEDFNCRFQDMQNIIEDKNSTSSRVRFFVMDVIDLRKNNWVPRREDIKPKTKSEIHADIKKEEELSQQQLHLMTSQPPRNRDRDDRDRDRKKSRDNRNNMAEDGGWNTVGGTTNNSRRIPLDGKRLQMTPFRHDNHVELRAGFSNWARGSSGGSGGLKEQEEEVKPNNRFAILDSQNMMMGDIRRNNQTGMGGPRLGPGGGNYHRPNNFGSKSMPPPLTEKDNSLISKRTFAQPGDRSKSNSRSSSRDNSISREIPSRPLPKEFVDYDASLKFSKGIIEEYASLKDVKEAMLCIEEKFHPSQVAWFVQATLEYATDRDSEKRSLVGRLFHDLMINKKLTLTQFLEGSNSVIEMTEDLRLDIPQVCGNLGEILAPLLLDGAINVKDLLKIVEPAAPKMIDIKGVPTLSGDNLDVQIFAKTLYSASKLLGPSRVQTMWMESKLTWDKLLNNDNVEEFLERFGVGFTVVADGGIVTSEEKIISTDNGSSQIEKKSSLAIPFDGPKIRKQLISMFKRDASNEEIFGWVEANVGTKATTTTEFARALTQALVESQMEISADGSHLAIGEDFQKNLKNKAKLVTKYVDNRENCELACIFGIQQVSVENQHPPGFMEQSFNAFYDQDVLSDDSFLEWAKNEDPEEQLGKGVCLTSVRKFLSWLQESEAEDSQQTDQSKPQDSSK